MAVMSWIFLYFHPLSKQWGGQPGLPSVPSSTAAAASSKMRLNCDSSPGFAIPSHDCEALAVDPVTLDILLFTKSHNSSIFRVPKGSPGKVRVALNHLNFEINSALEWNP